MRFRCGTFPFSVFWSSWGGFCEAESNSEMTRSTPRLDSSGVGFGGVSSSYGVLMLPVSPMVFLRLVSFFFIYFSSWPT